MVMLSEVSRSTRYLIALLLMPIECSADPFLLIHPPEFILTPQTPVHPQRPSTWKKEIHLLKVVLPLSAPKFAVSVLMLILPIAQDRQVSKFSWDKNCL